jgi:hypothetical protein
MNTVVARKQTAFRLSVDLVDKLKEAAMQNNRSLNNYVESLLIDIVYNRPNKLTLQAMKEANESENLETLSAKDLENTINSL